METDQSQTFSVVINKATRDPFIIESGLTFDQACKCAKLWYDNWSLLYSAKVAYPVVRFIVVKSGDETTFSEQSIVYRVGCV